MFRGTWLVGVLLLGGTLIAGTASPASAHGAAGDVDSGGRPAAAAVPTGFVTESDFYDGTTDPDQSLTATYDPNASDAAWVVTIHGGSWSSGTQANTQGAVNVFSAAGFQVFNISYRLIADGDGDDESAVPWPAQKQDVLDAISYIRTNAAHFGLDPNRGAIYGFSAGGHLAAIAGLTGDGDNGIRAIVTASGVVQPSRLWDDMNGVNPGEPATKDMVGLAGWTAVATGCPYGSKKGRCVANWQQFEPRSYISPSDPAVLMFQGTADTVVPYQMAQAFQQELTAANIPNQLVLVTGMGHDTHTALDGGPRQAEMLAFIRSRTSVDVAPSTTTMTASFDPSTVTNAQSSVLTAQVSSASDVDGAAVNVTVGSFATSATVTDGSVRVTVPPLAPGTYPASLTYLGSPTTQMANASTTLLVNPVTPTIHFTTVPKPLLVGHTLRARLVLTVHTLAGATSPATMTVRSGQHVIGTASIVDGKCSISLPTLSAGDHRWTATYSGTTTVAPATVPVVVHVAT